MTPRGLQASEHRILLVCGDLLAAAASVAVSIWIWSITAGFPFTVTFVSERVAWFLAAPAWTLVLLPSHNVRTALSARATAAALLRAMTVLLAMYLTLYFYLPPRALPRLVALYILWEGALFVLAWRLVYLWTFRQAPFQRRVLIVGTGEHAAAALRFLHASAPRNIVAAGVIDTAGAARSGVERVPVLGGTADLITSARSLGIAEIVVASPSQSDDDLFAALLECQELGVDIVRFPQLYEETLQRVPVAHVDREWLLNSFADAIRARDASRIVKRLLDVAGAGVGAVVLALLAPFIALAIALESGRPIFFRQARVGLGGALFDILKFRTMRPESESSAAGIDESDNRVTRVGALLRRTRLDELPNVLNVLRGEMSLVGPRPERPELVAVLERQVPFYRVRLIAKPGLTGWAQVNRAYGDPIDDAAAKLEYDLYYLKHRTAAFDVWILLRTVGTVLGLKGR